MRTSQAVLLIVLLAGAALAAHGSTGVPAPPNWLSRPAATASPQTGYAFAGFNNVPGRYDRNADGRVDLIVADRNGDGAGDYWATDRNFDGLFDDYQYDRNFDGRIDQWEYDLDYDGISDKIYVDSTGDGKPDMYADLNPITRTYTWYGNMQGVAAASMSMPPLKKGKNYAKGRAGFSD
jgi:hypothetical protein